MSHHTYTVLLYNKGSGVDGGRENRSLHDVHGNDDHEWENCTHMQYMYQYLIQCVLLPYLSFKITYARGESVSEIKCSQPFQLAMGHTSSTAVLYIVILLYRLYNNLIQGQYMCTGCVHFRGKQHNTARWCINKQKKKDNATKLTTTCAGGVCQQAHKMLGVTGV